EARRIGELGVDLDGEDDFGADIEQAEAIGEREPARRAVIAVGGGNEKEREREQRRDEQVDGENEARAGHLVLASLIQRKMYGFGVEDRLMAPPPGGGTLGPRGT